MVEDGAWEKTEDDILLIQDEGRGQDNYKGENSNDSRPQIPHFFICKYQPGGKESVPYDMWALAASYNL